MYLVGKRSYGPNSAAKCDETELIQWWHNFEKTASEVLKDLNKQIPPSEFTKSGLGTNVSNWHSRTSGQSRIPRHNHAQLLKIMFGIQLK